MKKWLLGVLVVVLISAGTVSMTEGAAGEQSSLPVKILLLPKFEVGQMTDDFPGEAQYYYEQYLMGAAEYDIPHWSGKLYYNTKS